MTRDGRSVRILCTDAKGDYPIVTLIETFDGTIEFVSKFSKDGHFLDNDGNNSNLDLFFVPENHEGWLNIYKSQGRLALFTCGLRYDSEEEARREAKQNAGSALITTVKIEWEE